MYDSFNSIPKYAIITYHGKDVIILEKRINDEIKIDFEVPKLLRNTMDEAEEYPII